MQNLALARKNEDLTQRTKTFNALFSAEAHISTNQLDAAMTIIDKAIADNPSGAISA